MEDILFNEYTIYISSKNGYLVGTGLKYLGKKGTIVIELAEEECTSFAEEFPTICQWLEENYMLQMYMTETHSYEASLGRNIGEGPYGEIDAFDVIEESGSLLLKDALLGMENSLKLKSNEKRNILTRMYRLYGSDKYQRTKTY